MLRGVLLLGIAAIFFALTSVFAKLGNGMGVPGMEMNFARFFMGFLYAGSYMLYYRRSIIPQNWNSVIGRCFFNILAASFFFLAIQHTTITNANMLNMTSPVYIFLLAPLFNQGTHTGWQNYLFLVLTMAGIYLVVVPDFAHINQGDVYGALSGLFGGIAISILHQARKYDSAHIILFYQMGLGSLTTYLLAMPTFDYPTWQVWAYVLLAGFSGAMAQVLLTIGYRYIDASTGSIVSSSQILVACTFGVLFFAEPLTWQVILGGFFILTSLVGISQVWRSARFRGFFGYD